MRIAAVFFLFALFAAVQSTPIESSSTRRNLRHDPAAQEEKPMHDKPVTVDNDEHANEGHTSHEKPGMHHDEHDHEEDKEHEKPGMHGDEHDHEGEEHGNPGTHDDEHDHEGEEHGNPGTHDDDKEDKEHGNPGTHDDEHDHEDEEHGNPGTHDDEHDHEDKEVGESATTEDAESSDDSATVVGSGEVAEPSAEADEGVCIGVTHLERFNTHELVFEKHVLARVLCDTAGSCATKGHIVNYKGESMMMGSYCDIVGCEKKVMQVNSPRYQRGMKIASVSDDMHFTAFAARFETRGEEAVLAAAVRVGL